jgi:hypothetical protein
LIARPDKTLPNPPKGAYVNRSYYSDWIQNFCTSSKQTILGTLAENSDYDINQNQSDGGERQIEILHPLLLGFEG